MCGESGSPACAAAAAALSSRPSSSAGTRLERQHGLALLHDDPLGEREPVRGLPAQGAEGRPLPSAGQPVDAVPGDVTGVGDVAGAVVHRAEQGVGVRHADQLDGDGLLLLHDQAVTAAARHAMQRVAHIEQEGDRVLPPLVRHVGDPRCGDPGEDGGIAQPAVRLLEIRLQQLARLAELLTAVHHQRLQVRQPLVGHRPPVAEDRPLQLLGQRGIAGDDARVQQPEHDLDVLAGQPACLAHRADAVVQAQSGVPDRVPDPLRHPRGLRRPRLVQEQQVEVAAEGELAAAVAAHGHQAEGVLLPRGRRGEPGGEPFVGERRERSASPRAGEPGATRQFVARGGERRGD